MSFSELGLGQDVLRAVADVGYNDPTPIQETAIPYILMGRDVLASAQTGTGKTASFTLPMIDILSAGRAKARMPRSLILEPTRELAAQVADNFDTYGKYSKLSKALLIGGESMAEQFRVLERGVDVLIATPGRLLDVFERGALLMSDVKILVIDEADRMLDMGFIPDVERIVTIVSRNRQTLLFSATMPPPIRKLADMFLLNPKEISVAPPSTPAKNVTQQLAVVSSGGGHREKRAALRSILGSEDVNNALIFCNRKRDVGILSRSLARHGFGADMLHGDMAQPARMAVLDRFKRGEVSLLVCSDVAARGLDIVGMSHVFNFDVPTTAEDYVHRIGRTARAGRHGCAVTIATPEDGKYVAAIEKLIGMPIERIYPQGCETGDLTVGKERGRRRPSSGNRARPKSETQKRHVEAPARSRNAGNSNNAQRNVEASQRPRNAVSDSKPAKPTKRRQRQSAEPDTPVVGMGDHVPAFLLRTPKK